MRTHGFLAFAFGICITAATCMFVLDAQDARIRSDFQRDAEKVADSTSTRLQTYFDVLLSLKGMFSVNQQVGRAQFARFVGELKLAERYPGFQAIEFLRAVPERQLARYAAAVRRDTSADPAGYPYFTVHPQVAGAEHFVIEFIEPMKGNENAFGLDLTALPVELAVVQDGRDSGQIVATGRITLVQDRNGEAGFVARAPVYRTDLPLTTVAQRRAAFIGQVAIVFRVNSLMREMIDPALREHMSIRVYDAGSIRDGASAKPAPANIMFDAGPVDPAARPRFSTEARIDVAQRRWVMQFTALHGSRYGRDISRVVLIGLAGLVISTLIGALIMSSGRSRTLAGRLRATLDGQRAAQGRLEQSLAELAQQKAQVDAAHAELSSALATLKQAQANLITSEKMASLGALVAGIAHELNTPIGNSLLTATALADMAVEFENKVAGGSVRRSALEAHLADVKLACGIMAGSLRRAADLITSFKQVAVDQASDQRRRFNLCEVVRDTLATYAAQLRRAGCEARVDAPDVLMLDSYPGSVGQVLSNLINNALLHAFGGRSDGHIVIVAREIEGDRLQLVFSDDGAGMPAKILRQVFDPFFTTKMGQGGSGLGMNIVYNIVTRTLGGGIAIESAEGSGTSVTITLPMQAPSRAGDSAGLTMLMV